MKYTQQVRVSFESPYDVSVEGESSQRLTKVFSELKQSATHQPTILVIDNFDAVGTGESHWKIQTELTFI